jgi:hypothetical protein
LSKKAEARAAKQAERDQKFEAAKVKILAKMNLAEGPKIATLPSEEKFRLAVGEQVEALVIPQQPIAVHNGSQMGLMVSWCIRKCDHHGTWTWDEPRAWETKEWEDVIRPAMLEFEKLTWGDIDQQASGAGHKLHHFQELANISSEAQERWVELGHEEFDTLFRFRMGNKRRFWGFVVQGHFFSVWWERQHKIAPTKPK